jgi:hypothetical protein
MTGTRRFGEGGKDLVRSDMGSGRALPAGPMGPSGRVPGVAPGGRQRIPTIRQMASLVVNGILTLPRYYRRGMFLDIMV